MSKMLEQALQSWPHWSIPVANKPQLLKPLTEGKTNQSYLCQAQLTQQPGDLKLVIRINNPTSQTLGIDRQHEQKILQQVSRAGVSPKVYFWNQHYLVSEFIEGDCWTKADLQDPVKVSGLLELLACVHQLPVDIPEFDYLSHAENYWQQLIHSGRVIPEELHKKREQLLPVITEFQNAKTPRVLCHHDLVLANIMETNGQLKLLDWEYAGLGIAEFDRVALIMEGANLEQTVLEEAETVNASHAKQIYEYLYDLWMLIR